MKSPVKRTGKKIMKQNARKGINIDKSAQEDLEIDKDESVEAMNPTPLTTKSNSMTIYDTHLFNEDAIWSLPTQQKDGYLEIGKYPLSKDGLPRDAEKDASSMEK
ncbi:hypothetical protein Tco_0409315 [Tanacetum coccineum]